MAAASETAVKAVKSSPVSLLLLRLAISFVFAFAALGKLFDLPGFQRSLDAVDWIPTPLIFPSALLLILFEMSAAILLWRRRTLRAGVILSAALSLGFSLFTAQRLLVGASTDCSCFGIFLKLNPWIMLLVDAALFTASLAILKLARIRSIPKPVAKTDTNIQSLRLPYLIAALLACVWIFFKVLPHDPILREQVGGLLSFNQVARAYTPITPGLLLRDPAMGASLPVPPAGGLDSHKPTFVVFTTGCSICSLGGLAPAEQAGRLSESNVVMVSPVPLSQMKQFITDHHLRVLPVSDPKNQYDHSYNLSFRPRTYLLDSAGRLVWKQATVRPDVNDLERDAQALSGGIKQ